MNDVKLRTIFFENCVKFSKGQSHKTTKKHGHMILVPCASVVGIVSSYDRPQYDTRMCHRIAHLGHRVQGLWRADTMCPPIVYFDEFSMFLR